MISRLSPFLLLIAGPAFAGDQPAYLDDRSDPATIVRSYYNAVDRHEHARAWSYFGDRKPVADYAAFVAGYAETDTVDLLLGSVTTEGAAGSIYGTVPVAITATATDGSTRTFAGCYVTRQVQPAIQEPPFRPLQIESGTLHPAEPPLAAALPDDCQAD